MNIYLMMGTHLPEVRRCMEHLGGMEECPPPVRFLLPEGLEWPPPEKGPATMETYDPASAHWVFNPDADGTVFILLDPRLSPVEQLESIAGDLRKCLLEPVKVVTCVDCHGVRQHSALRSWYDACIYYSDIVLLGNRKADSNRFVRDFQKQYERNCYPCLFLFLKGPGIPEQALEILTPGTRRLSQLFDLETDLPVRAIPGVVIESSCDLDFEEEETDPFRYPASELGLPNPVPDVTAFVVSGP